MDGLTQSQIARLAKLSDDHIVVGEREGSPVVERPDGRLVCVHAERSVGRDDARVEGAVLPARGRAVEAGSRAAQECCHDVILPRITPEANLGGRATGRCVNGSLWPTPCCSSRHAF